MCGDAIFGNDRMFLLQLPTAKQVDIANELDRKPGEVLKKLEDIRNKIL